MEHALFVLYVADQERAAEFYGRTLDRSPRLHVPGMTEFSLGAGCALGLMPEAGIRRLLGDALPDPAAASGIPRAELYLFVADPEACLRRALDAGATLLDEVAPRDWGDRVGYCLDPDGHVLAFATGAT